MDNTTRTTLLSMPTDIQEAVWRQYHTLCMQDLVSHTQRHLHRRLVKEVKTNARMCVCEIEDDYVDAEAAVADEFPNWFFQEQDATTTHQVFRNWIEDGEPSFDEWWTQ